VKSNKFLLVTTLIVAVGSLSFVQATTNWQQIDATGLFSVHNTTTQSSRDIPTELFAYDSTKPFQLKELSKQEQAGVVIADVEYASYSAKRGPIKAYLVSPAKKGSFAGVLFFHWLGRPKGDRTQFLDEAISLAKQGTVSLLIQGHFPWQVDPSEGVTDRQLIIDETIEVRRALDLLLSQPMVDRRRIAYVGHDYGAMYGSLTAGVEKRVKTYVLIAGLGTFADWSLEYWLNKKPDDFKKQYVQAMQGLDPILSIKRAVPATLLFQFANLDTYITHDAALAFYRAASSPKQIKWYQTTHEMDIEAARVDRRNWLTQKLGLRRLSV